jgi:hypothetical protein
MPQPPPRSHPGTMEKGCRRAGAAPVRLIRFVSAGHYESHMRLQQRQPTDGNEGTCALNREASLSIAPALDFCQAPQARGAAEVEQKIGVSDVEDVATPLDHPRERLHSLSDLMHLRARPASL